jgi:hypothetical protein
VSESVVQFVVVVKLITHDHIDNCDSDQNQKANEQSRGVEQECGHKTSAPEPEENVALGARKFKKLSYRGAVSLSQLTETLEHGLCPRLDRTLERFGQCAGVKARNAGGNSAC